LLFDLGFNRGVGKALSTRARWPLGRFDATGRLHPASGGLIAPAGILEGLEMMSARILNCEVTSRRRWTGARGLQNRIPMARKRRDYPGNLGKVRVSWRGFASRRQFHRIFQIIRIQPAGVLPANEKREKSGLWAAEILPAKPNC
jgi:hypothetical protein